MSFITDPEINYLYCSGLGGVLSPLQEVQGLLGNSASDQMMKLGLSMMNQPIQIQIINTLDYSSWDDVKKLYVNFYLELLAKHDVSNRLMFYQESLNQLRTNP